jgi:DNA mismatch repair protein MutL
MLEAPPRQPIAQLAPDEVEKICAGEVVERPLSVVKELVENALDAGARRISVELAGGGAQLIRVSDDGGGIPLDELPLALKRHCTSKLRHVDDLFALNTLGFRGEALGAVAAVSRLTLTSRHSGAELGGVADVSGGALMRHEPAGCQVGTDVEVRELFFNTPARLKFLRSPQAETAAVSQLLTGYTLAYPEVRWELASNGRTLLNSGGDGSLLGALARVLGSELAAGLIALDFEFPPHAVRGFITDPRHHRHNRLQQWYFVNRRPVVNKLLYRAVDDGVREYLSPGKFPAGVFMLELPPEEIDVNIHPQKSEVNFASSQEIYSLLSTAIRRALGTAAGQRQQRLTAGLAGVIKPAQPGSSAVPSAAGLAPEDEQIAPDGGDYILEQSAPPGQRAIPVYREGQRVVLPGQPASPPPQRLDLIDYPGAGPALGAAAASGTTATPGTEAQSAQAQPALDARPSLDGPAPVITQIAGSFLAVATPDALYLIDQHAAHERVLFEQLSEALQPGARMARQRLLFPLTLTLAPAEAELAREWLPALNQLGFAAELGAGHTLVVAETPLPLRGRVDGALLHGVLAELAEDGASAALADRLKALAASLACKAAIKAGMPLSPAERRELAGQVLARASSLSCPHGRPTILELGADALGKLFLRG